LFPSRSFSCFFFHAVQQAANPSSCLLRCVANALHCMYNTVQCNSKALSSISTKYSMLLAV